MNSKVAEEDKELLRVLSGPPARKGGHGHTCPNCGSWGQYIYILRKTKRHLVMQVIGIYCQSCGKPSIDYPR